MEIEQFSTSNYPPGFRFHPSDEELIVHYLLKKISSRPLPADVVAEIELYKYNPWELPNKSLFGEDEWYFFTPRDRKYPNGQRPSRTAGSGYWKATGTDKAILGGSGSRSIGVKKALVFYKGRPPKGTKTEWIMTEYRLPDTVTRSSRSKGSKRLDDWVLCRIRQKGNMSKNNWADNESPSSSSAVDFFPKIEELPSAYIKSNVTEITTDYLMKDCHILASMLACQDLPPIENISNVTTFPIRNNNSGSWFNYDHTYNNKYDNLVGLNKMATSEMNGSSQVVIPGNMMMTTSAMNFCNQNVQGQGNIFNVPIHSDAIMNLLLSRKDF